MLLQSVTRERPFFTRTEFVRTVGEHGHEYDTKLVEVSAGRRRKKIGALR